MNIPDPITLAPEDAQRIVKLNEKRAGNEAFVQSVITAGERRNVELLAEGRALWEELGKKHSLDLEHVSYDIKDGQLIAVAVRV